MLLKRKSRGSICIPTHWWAFSLILADSSVLAFLFVFNKSDFKMLEINQYDLYKIGISSYSSASCLGSSSTRASK